MALYHLYILTFWERSFSKLLFHFDQCFLFNINAVICLHVIRISCFLFMIAFLHFHIFSQHAISREARELEHLIDPISPESVWESLWWISIWLNRLDQFLSSNKIVFARFGFDRLNYSILYDAITECFPQFLICSEDFLSLFTLSLKSKIVVHMENIHFFKARYTLYVKWHRMWCLTTYMYTLGRVFM